MRTMPRIFWFIHSAINIWYSKSPPASLLPLPNVQKGSNKAIPEHNKTLLPIQHRKQISIPRTIPNPPLPFPTPLLHKRNEQFQRLLTNSISLLPSRPAQNFPINLPMPLPTKLPIKYRNILNINISLQHPNHIHPRPPKHSNILPSIFLQRMQILTQKTPILISMVPLQFPYDLSFKSNQISCFLHCMPIVRYFLLQQRRQPNKLWCWFPQIPSTTPISNLPSAIRSPHASLNNETTGRSQIF